jgi:hypothetical protein
MTHLPSTSVTIRRLSSSLPNKAWRVYKSLEYFSMLVQCTGLHPTEVHTQITISRYSDIDYSHGFVGSALARFERSTLSDHEGTRNIVLRFLKIITLVRCVIPLYDGHVCCPKEGDLHRNKHSVKSNRQVWSVNIDIPQQLHVTRLQPGLRLLWDT